ncbi:MAG: alpha/beta fold hydrolase [candidate division Zixibacteria bacterium]|nr:alpha/beta fold hydrolase [candidate division Zixibacteria bacterium]
MFRPEQYCTRGPVPYYVRGRWVWSSLLMRLRDLMTPILQWTIGLLLGIILLKLLVLWLQPRMAFYPIPGATPAPAPLADFTVTTSDGVDIRGWQSPIADTGPVFIYSCGNAGSLADRTDLLQSFVRAGGQIVAYNYRGTGSSEGSPSEQGVYADAEAVYGYVRDQLGVDSSRIVLWGHSLGGAVTTELATRRPCQGVVLEATFRSAKVMAGRMMPILPVSWLMTYKLDNETAVAQLDVPIFFIHGTRDPVVPIDDSEILHDLARHPFDLWRIEEAGHNDNYLVAGSEFFERIIGFGRDVVGIEVSNHQ